MTFYRPLAALAPAMLLAACASAGDYPSLAIRDAERAQGTFTPDAPATPPVPAPPPPLAADVAQRLARLTAQARGTHAEFERAAPSARRAAAASGATGSDSWAAAQVALADLDSIRSRAAVALADADALWAESQIAGPDQPAIAEARRTIESLIAREDQVLAELRGRVRN